VKNNKEVLIDLDKDLDKLKKSLYSKDTLKLDEEDMIVLKSVNAKFKDIIGLINYLVRNQRELSTSSGFNCK